MDQLRSPDVLGALSRGYGVGTNMRLQREDEQRQSGLRDLASQAYSAPQEQQGSILSQMAALDPRAAAQQQSQFESDEDRRNKVIASQARLLLAAPPDARPALYARQRATLSQYIPNLPEQYDGTVEQAVTAISQAYGGSGQTVQSTRVGADGYYYTVDRQGNWVNSGVKADPRTQLRDQPGIDPSIVDLRSGKVSPLGGATQPAVQESSGMPVSFSNTDAVPPEVQQAIRANPDAWGSVPSGTTAAIGDLTAARPAIAPAEAQRLELARQASARADEASQRAAQAAEEARVARERGNAPAGFRFRQDGSLEPIPGGPKPAGAAASEDERKAAAWLAQADNAFTNMRTVLTQDPEADSPGIIETYSPSEELGNRSRSDTRQQYVQASESLSEALLRAATGAGINEHEAQQKVFELTPRRGDSDAVKRQKMAAIPVYLQALKARAGRAAATVTAGQAQAPSGAGSVDDLLGKYGIR